MATKVKPSRLNVSGTACVWYVPVYLSDDCFCWWAWWGWWWSWDMQKCVYDPNNCNDDAFNYCNFYNTPDMSCYAQCSDIPTDNCQLNNGCWYLQISDLCCYAQCCDIPTDNCQLSNGCWYINNLTCSDVTSALWYSPYDSNNPDWYTSCTWTLQSCDIATVNWCCLTNWGNICITWWSDYSWCTKTISWWCVELWLRTIVNSPESDFTLTAPSTIQEWEEYVIRTNSHTSYNMCLWSCFTNPWNVNTCLSCNATDQFSFLWVCWKLELQPLVATWS